MKIFLVRHAETIEGEQGIILGSLGGNISENGKKKYQELIQNSDFFIEKIYTSPLNRAKNSAKMWQEKFSNISLEENFLLSERKSGIAEGKKESEIDWENYEKIPLTKRKHIGGESFEEVFERAEKFLKFLQNQKEDNILIVSHSVWILMFLACVQGISIEEALRISLDNTVLKIEIFV